MRTSETALKAAVSREPPATPSRVKSTTRTVTWMLMSIISASARDGSWASRSSRATASPVTTGWAVP